MRIESIHVHRVPGIDRAFTLDFAHALSLVRGRNGAGKSSIARLVATALLDVPADRGALATVRLRDGGEPIDVEITAGARTWPAAHVDSDPVASPEHPIRRHAGCWVLAIDEIGRFGQDVDASVARAIAIELAGGDDPAAALRTLNPQQSSVPMAEKRAYEEAQRRITTARDAAERLRTDLARVPDLERTAERGRRAERRLGLLQDAVRLHLARRRLREDRERLDAFDPRVLALRGDELDRLDALRETLDKERAAAHEAETGRAEAERLRDALGFADAPPSKERIDRLRDEVRSWATAEQEASDADDARGSAARAFDAIVTKLDVDRDHAAARLSAVALDAELVERVDALLHEEQSLRARLEVVEERERTLPSADPDPARRRALENALLRLGAPPERVAAPSAAIPWWRVVVSTIVVLAVGTVLGLRDAGLDTLDLVLAIVAAVVAGVLAGIPDRRATEVVLRSAEPGEDLSDLARLVGAPSAAADEPPADRTALVGRVADSLLEERTREQAASRRESIARERAELDDARARFEETRGALLERLPLARLAGALDARLVAGAMLELVECARAEALADEKLRQARARADERCERVQRSLASLASSEVVDLPRDAEAIIDELDRSRSTWEQQTQRIVGASKTLEQITERVARIDTDARALLEALEGSAEGGEHGRAALDLIDRAELRALVDAVEPVRLLSKSIGESRTTIETLEESIGDDLSLADLDDDARDAERVELERRRDAGIAAVEERTRIDERLRSASVEREASDAIDERERAREFVASRREDRLERLAATIMLERARDVAGEAAEGPVLARASRILRRVTGGAYELAIDHVQGEPKLRARDVTQDAWRDLEQLSTGTRVQALVAARLAFIESQEAEFERGRRLPLVVDDAFAHADAERFDAAGALLADEARAGRHVLFLAADAGQVEHLRTIAAEVGVACDDVDLDVARGASSVVANGALTFREVSPPPSAEPGEDVASYAARVHAIVPRAHDPFEALDVVHLLPDRVDLASGLRSMRIDSVGVLASLFDSSGVHRLLGEDEAFVRERLESARLAWERRAIGRGRPWSVEDLHAMRREGDKPLVTTRFVDRFLEHGRTNGFDASSLLAALDSGGIKSYRYREELEEALREHGILDDREPRVPTEIAASVAADLALSHDAPAALESMLRWWDACEAGGATSADG